MAVNEIQGAELLHEFSEDGILYKPLVCAQAGSVEYTSNVTKEKTKCGPITSIDLPDWKTSGDAVANMLPTTGQWSLNDVTRWIQTMRKIYMRVQSPEKTIGNTDYALGELYYRAGQGYFASITETIDNGSVAKFSWSFEGNETLVIAKPGGGGGGTVYDYTMDFTDTASVSDSTGGVAGIITAPSATIKLKYNQILVRTGLPASMTLMSGSTLLMVVDASLDYVGQNFVYIGSDSVSHTVVFADGNVQVV